MAELDYSSVHRYWNKIQPSRLGPYMMDGFGFPEGAGHFRFRAEMKIVQRLAESLRPEGAVLDLGSGVGHWAEFFAGNFGRVVAVEDSASLYEALRERAASHPNIEAIRGNVMEFAPNDRYELIFLGGLLMYLNEPDLIALLRRLVPFLAPGGMMLCRESTVREGTLTRQGEYQATYRSEEAYEAIFRKGGLVITRQEINAPYVLLQMGCEMMSRWKSIGWVGERSVNMAGRLVYWGLRLGNPLIRRLPGALGFKFPQLTNHFFALQPVGVVEQSNSPGSRRRNRVNLGPLAAEGILRKP